MNAATDGTDLPHEGRGAQAEGRSPASGPWVHTSEASEATSVPDGESSSPSGGYVPRWRNTFEAVYHDAMAPHRARWEARGSNVALSEAQRVYAHARRRTIGRPYHARAAACLTRELLFRCACGPSKRKVECRQFLVCGHCRSTRAKKQRTRVRRGLEAAFTEAQAGGFRVHLVMLTLTVRHSGDVADDRQAVADAWRRFRQAYHRRFGRFAFVGTYEATAGRDELGHVHAHVVAVLPIGKSGDGTGGDWKLLRRMWVRAAHGRSTNIDMTASKTPKFAAGYVSKYLTKSVTTNDFPPGLSARVVAATYNTRWIFSSVRFWEAFTPECPCCKGPITRVTFVDYALGPCSGIPPYEFHRGLGCCGPEPDPAEC